MPHTRPPYSPEFRRQMVDLVRAGRDPADLAREFEPSAQAIRNWVAQSDRREGRREEKSDVLPAAERDELVRLHRENKQLRLERDILSRTAAWFARDRARRRSMARCRPGLRIHEREPEPAPAKAAAVFPIATMARVLGVSETGYHAWRHRPPSTHALADAALLKRVRTVHANSRETYGAPRVHAALRAGGERHGRKRIARLMRDAGLVGASRHRNGPVTNAADKEARPAPDLVDRRFSAPGPNRLWVADITFIPTAAGFLYLAVVLDAWSRKIVGWSMANHLRAELVLAALAMAIGQRRPRDVITTAIRAANIRLWRSASAASITVAFFCSNALSGLRLDEPVAKVTRR